MSAYQIDLTELENPPTPAEIQRERDPYGIVPEDFWSRYSSIEAAARDVENPERRRCVNCGGTNISKKADTGGTGPGNRRPEPFRCHTCGRHQWEPDPPKGEEEDQTDLEAFADE